jgi:hypothetical protein
MLRCFVDESGNNEGPVMVMAGVIADSQTWLSFSEQWQECLDMRPKLAAFHMKDAFSSWGDESQERVTRFHRIHAEHVQASIVVSLPLKDYREIFGHVERLSNPYIFLLFDLIKTYARHHQKLGLGRNIEFVFDEQMGADRHVLNAWQYLSEHAPSIRHILGSTPKFENDEKVLPLQSADMLAWWIRRFLVDDFKGRPRLKQPWRLSDEVPCIRVKHDRLSLKRAYHMMFSKSEDGSIHFD